MTISQINPNQLRPSGDDGPGRIIHVGPERWPEAVQRLVGTGAASDRDHGRRFLEYARLNRINLRGMWSRLDGAGRITATVLAVPSPGRTAMMFASRVIGRDSDKGVESTAGLIDFACGELSRQDVNLAQSLLDPSETNEQRVFLLAGFSQLAVLSYLEKRLSRAMTFQKPQWPAGVRVQTYRDSLRDQLVAVLDASYEETLDCPGLRGHRATSDILEGHRASGVFNPNLWTLLYVDDVPRGALLLNPAADQQSVELVYVGLAKPLRGRGLGRQLLRHGFVLLANKTWRSITLAVDEANEPALALYRQEGFRLALRRIAMIRPL